MSWPVGLNDQGEFGEQFPDTYGTPTNWLVSRSGALNPLGLDHTPEDWIRLEETVAQALSEPIPAFSAIPPRGFERAPPFSLPDLLAKNVRLNDFYGNVLVVSFFTSDSSDWAGDSPVAGRLTSFLFAADGRLSAFTELVALQIPGWASNYGHVGIDAS